MAGPDIETRMKRIALILLATTLSIAGGAGLARWALASANGFYMNPIDAYGAPARARRQPVADSFWDRQGAVPPTAPQAGATSTATSAQPSYRSASGS